MAHGPTKLLPKERKLLKRMHKTCIDYELLAPNDRVMVAISGGKDSHVLLHLLHRARRSLPFSIDLVAVHLDQNQPGYDGRALRTYLEALGAPFEILSEDTYSIVLERTEEGRTYCAICSRLRRGILYTAAERLGCNKIALGHHREDTLETFLMNLLYSGKLQAMPPKYTTNDDRFEVIRPLIECSEDEIASLAEDLEFPIIPCNLCGAQPGGTQRDAMDRLLSELEQTHPHVRQVMLNALRNIRPTHLLDRDVGEAWQARPEHVRPDPEPKKTERHFAAAPSNVRRLPIVG